MLGAGMVAWLALAAGAAVGPVARAMPEILPGTTVTFDFETARYLNPGQIAGGLAYLSDGAPRGASVPLVLFLHGLNPVKAMHPWFNGNPGDLRQTLGQLVRDRDVAPLVIAAPTQSKDALVPRILWPEFDPDAFVAAVEQALEGRAYVDRNAIVMVGHSGGACNPRGGIVGSVFRAKTFVARAVLAVDSCMEPEVADNLLLSADATRVRVYYQPFTWPRQYAAFCRRIERGPRSIDGGPGDRACIENRTPRDFPHDAILVDALEGELPTLFPGQRRD